ncbi:MAG TPA: PhzF family phenazine biosynthesis protein [Pirellulales bacterium]|nr:PhzF family phenazine biosynthesis protein [Pirellulales bacterium]
MSRVKCWQVDAFADRPFTGNPAAVCWLEEAADPVWMQAVAAEMNLSETAFARRVGDGYELRWFTPAVEVDLCGHATLAAAHALWTGGVVADEPLCFHTKSGVLTCLRAGQWIELDFPSTPAEATSPTPALMEGLGVEPAYVGKSKFYTLVEVESAAAVRSLRPDFAKLGQAPTLGVIVTAHSDDPRFDFISRFFAPALGVDEDPVCGSAHCVLTPYWAEKLGKTQLLAYQASARGGVLRLRLGGDRVILGGQAVTVWQGELWDGAA